MGYLDGFGVVMKKWFGVKSDTGARITRQYPEQTRPKPERFHGRHVLNRYEDGMEKCIGCELCAGVCPANCIYVRGQDNDPDDPTSPGERFGFIYEINYLRCIHCDLCVEACPTEAITETKLFEFAFTNRADAIYTKAELVVGDDGRPQQLPWENWDGGFDAAEDSSGWMRATSPSGSSEFEGIVAWAGELGYGVRPPERATIEEESGPVPRGAGHSAADDHAHGHDDHDHEDAPAEPADPEGAVPAPHAVEFDAVDADVDAPAAADEEVAAPPADSGSRPVTFDAVDTTADAPAATPARSEPRPVKFDAVETVESDEDAEPETVGAPDAEPVDGSSDTAAETPAESTPAGTTPAESTPADEPPAAPPSTAGFFDAPDEPTPKKRGFRR